MAVFGIIRRLAFRSLNRTQTLLRIDANNSQRRSKILDISRDDRYLSTEVSKHLSSFETSVNESETDSDAINIERQELLAFDQTYQRIIDDMIPNTNRKELIEAFRWIEKIVHYNVPNGKRNRGLALVMSYRLLVAMKGQTGEDIELARILGWCVELLQAYFLVVDDLVDQSITRRGQLCWYRQDGVGLMACNDAILIETGIYYIIKSHFKDKPYYSDILDLMLEITRYTSYGQCLDLLSNPPGRKPDITSFSAERYAAIVKYKTAFYSFCLPVRLAMFMSNWSETSAHRDAEKILLKMGHFFQVQDDYLDCFGDPKVIGKVGTDIEEGKCSWPIITALQHANELQKKILQDNYGLHNTEAVAQVKAVYRELNIESLYRDYEDFTFTEICQLIKEIGVSSNLPTNIFYGFLSKIHRRIK